METGQKLKLLQRRSFSENIEVTFDFVKQNYLTICKSIAILIPITLIIAILSGLGVGSSVNTDVSDPMEAFFAAYSMSTIIAQLLNMILAFVFVLYTALYVSEYVKSIDGKVSSKIVWSKMKAVFLTVLIAQILCAIFIGVGFILCIIPGLIIGVYLVFFMYEMVYGGTNMMDSFQKSYSLVKGNWFSVFGFLLLVSMIVSIVVSLLSIPMYIIIIGQSISGEIFSPWMIIAASWLAQIGNLLLTPILIIAVGIYYFSLRSDIADHEVMTRIDELGN